MLTRRTLIQRAPLLFLPAATLVPARAAGLEPSLNTRGELLLDDSEPTLTEDGWKQWRGSWKLDKGGILGEQIDLEPVYHAGVGRAVKFGDAAVIEGEVMLDGAKACWLSLNGSGHVGRIVFNPGQVELREDIGGGDNLDGIPTIRLPLKTGKWYPFVWEFRGEMMAAEIERENLFAEHPYFKQLKNNIGFSVASDAKYPGGIAGLRKLKIYDSTAANPKWKKPKVKKPRE